MFSFTTSQRSALRGHKYSGADNSLLYKYVLSPFAAWCVDLLPTWVAPNVITLVGLALPVAVHAVGHYYSPTMGCEDVPRWFYLASAFALAFYQTLDNMDGKQARRTSSSSPLGQLFDHGCDAINAYVSGVTFGVTCCCGTSSPALLAVVLLTPTVPFFSNTWEEWHTGSMNLPIFNGPSEGIWIVVGLNLMCFWHGTEWWEWPCPLLESYTCSQVMVALSAVLVTATASMQVIGVLVMYYRRGVRGLGLVAPLAGLLPMVWLIVWGGLWMRASGTLLHARPRAFFGLFGALFVEAVVSLIISHVTKSTFQVWRTLALPLPLWWALAKYHGFTHQMQEIVLIAHLNVAVAYVAWMLSELVHECCSALDVKCFAIPASGKTQ